MNKNALDAGISARRMDDGMGDKVIDANHVAMYFRTCGENVMPMGSGMNIATIGKPIVPSLKRPNGA